MSEVTQVPLRPLKRGSLAKLWLALLLLAIGALWLAWAGAGAMRSETTPSGLKFRVVSEGTGDPIRPTDGAFVEYEGRLPDGRVFDSTAGKGPVGMIPGQLIPGFNEALLKMREGGRYRIEVPANLAYGAAGAGDGVVPPNTDLTFDVTIRQILRNAALMLQQQQPGGPAGAAPGQAPPQLP